MNAKASITFIGVAALAALLGCSTPQPATPAAATVPPPEASYDLPLEQPGPTQLPALCKLGTSCLAMDPRPFEPCLLSTKKCRDKAAEPIEVGQPEWLGPPPAIIETTY